MKSTVDGDRGMDSEEDMSLSDCREKIDALDDELLELFMQRMSTVGEVAKYKKAHNKAVFNKSREREILSKVSNRCSQTNPELVSYSRALFSNLFELSRSYQKSLLATPTPLTQKIEEALEVPRGEFPGSGIVACQGIEGAHSQIACDKMFRFANIVYFETFDSVFQAVEQGLCEFGILPIENSSYGSVNDVYDLMKDYNFHVVRSVKLKVNHALLAPVGTKLEDIREIYSHEQALGQCAAFLKEHSNIKIQRCENTATAARDVAHMNRSDVAAISSRQCAELYGLNVLLEGAHIQSSEQNCTRFICISKDLRVYPGANRMSVMLQVPHEPGSLYATMSKFAALGLNLTKLESRPIIGRDFEFMFYFDFDASLKSSEVIKLLEELSAGPELFVFLGNYSEV